MLYNDIFGNARTFSPHRSAPRSYRTIHSVSLFLLSELHVSTKVAAAVVKSDEQRLVLLANTNSSRPSVGVKGATGGVLNVVDGAHGCGEVP